MKKVLKFCSVILLVVFVFGFFGVSHSFATSPLCGPCCGDADCAVLAGKTIKCNGAVNTCVLPTNVGTGQCKISGETTFCPFSRNNDIEVLVNEVSKWMLVVALVLAPLMILFGAFYMLTAAGDPSRSAKGRTIIIWASIALAIFLFVKAFVSILRYLLGF